MRILGIIPAKGNSTRVPNKNMRKVNGLTLISRAMYSAYPLTEVLIASDSTNILTYADTFKDKLKDYPLFHLFRIPNQDSMAQLEPIMESIINNFSNFDAYMLLQPTSPLRSQKDVKGAIGIMEKTNCDSVISVSPATHHYHFVGTLEKPNDGVGVIFNPLRDLNKRTLSQNLSPMAAENGAVYLFTKKHWDKTKNRMGGNMRAMIMDDPFGLDIDYEKDIRFADIFLKGLEGDKS